MEIDLFSTFKLPKANIKEKHDDKSSPAVPWLDGLLGNVAFEEWKLFEFCIFEVLCIVYEKLTNDDQIKDVKTFLNAARSTIAPTQFPDEADSPRVFPDCASLSTVYPSIMRSIEDIIQRIVRNRTGVVKSKSELLRYPDKLMESMAMLENGTATSKKANLLPEEFTPDYMLMILGHLDDTLGVPMCAFCLDAPCSNILASRLPRSAAEGTMSDVTEVSSPQRPEPESTVVSRKELCARYNDLFAARPKVDKSQREAEESNPEFAALLPVARALTYALSTSTGFVFLCNYDFGVAFEVVKNDDSDQIRVRVSRPFHREEDMSCVLAMIALAVHSTRKRTRLETGIIRYIKGLGDKIANHTADVQAVNSGTNRDSDFARCGDKRGMVGSEPATKRVKHNAVGDKNDDGIVISIEEARHLGVGIIAGSGNSGEVLKAVLNGKSVAIKKWNGISTEGFNCLLNEVRTLNWMKRECPLLLGTVIPRVHLAWSENFNAEDEKNGPIVVTQFVGEDIFRHNGILYVQSEAQGYPYFVSPAEEARICEAALQGLRKLQGEGVLHGSIYLRNIRVARELSEDGALRWRVWWIDFGRAVRVHRDPDLPCFRRERRKCREMFLTRCGSNLCMSTMCSAHL